MSRFRIPNPKVVVLCILAATTFWFLNAMNKNYVTTVSVPVRFQFDEQQFVKVEDVQEFFDVNVNGSGWDIFLANLGYGVEPCVHMVESIDSKGRVQATSLFQEVAQSLPDLEVNYVLRKNLKTGLELKVTKDIALKVNDENLPFDSYTERASQIAIKPNVVSVEGPISQLNVDSVTLDRFVNVELTDDSLFAQSLLKPKFSEFCKVAVDTIQIVAKVTRYKEVEKNTAILIKGKKGSTARLDFDSVRVRFLIETTVPEYNFKNGTFYVELKELDKSDSTLLVKSTSLNLRELEYQPKKVKFLGYE